MSNEQERELRTKLISARKRRKDAVIFEIVYATVAVGTGVAAFASHFSAHSKQIFWMVCVIMLINAAGAASRRVTAAPAVTEAQAALNEYLAAHPEPAQESQQA